MTYGPRLRLVSLRSFETGCSKPVSRIFNASKPVDDTHITRGHYDKRPQTSSNA